MEKLEKKEDLNESSNKLNIFLILLGIFLLGGIALTLFLFCRKKAGQDKEKNTEQIMHIELDNIENVENLENNDEFIS